MTAQTYAATVRTMHQDFGDNRHLSGVFVGNAASHEITRGSQFQPRAVFLAIATRAIPCKSFLISTSFQLASRLRT
jgi:hypothetical protein